MKQKGLKVLVLGSGGREHAIVHKLALSSRISSIFVSPGNASSFLSKSGVTIQNVSSLSVKDVAPFAKEKEIDFVFVGPEQPLVDGVADLLAEANIPCFGPSAAAARLEGSKADSKVFMAKHSIPTAPFAIFNDHFSASRFVDYSPTDVVVKASGLAAGKGAIVPKNKQEAKDAIHLIMEKKAFGIAGETLVVEEKLEGNEISILLFTDGVNYVVMPPAEDYKRALDGDKGPNTGGMGAIAPSPLYTEKVKLSVCEKIIEPTLRGMREEGRPYVGIMYIGLMLTESGPSVLEYNCRFGDPETQVILPLLKTDLVDIIESCISCSLSSLKVEWEESASVCVVATSEGYPASYPKGRVISGLSMAQKIPQTEVFHAGTSFDSATREIKTSGGRVLSTSSKGETIASAASLAYKAMSLIHFDGITLRNDIGRVRSPFFQGQPLKVGVIGSTRGTDLQTLFEAISNGRLPGVEISVVGSNIKSAGILEKAKAHSVPTFSVSYKKCQGEEERGKERERGDKELGDELGKYGLDVILLIGWMRILSDSFIRRFQGRLLNVHPSLLPLFGGSMDLNTHKAVIDSNERESGCTIHRVTEEVDGGEIILQKKCVVEREGEMLDDPDSLKAKVQALEGAAFLEVLGQLFNKKNHEEREERKRKREDGEEEGLTYKKSGVDVTMGNDFVDILKPLAASTKRPGSNPSLGGFGGMFDLKKLSYKDPIICSTTDGVGTKLLLAQKTGIHTGVGIDLVAMCVNDLIVQGAEPLYFLDYFATGHLSLEYASSIIKGVAEGCILANCALIGGETAEMPGLYSSGEYDMAGFAVGAVEREEVLPKCEKMKEGDVLLTLSSSGVHSNGFSLVRKLVDLTQSPLDSPPPFESNCQSLGEALMTPTRIYISALLPLIQKGILLGAAHITGGGLTENVPRVLPKNLKAFVDGSKLNIPPVFKWIQQNGKVKETEMLRTFNCGVGMILVVDGSHVDEAISLLKSGSDYQPGDGTIIGSLKNCGKEEEENISFVNLESLF